MPTSLWIHICTGPNTLELIVTAKQITTLVQGVLRLKNLSAISESGPKKLCLDEVN